MIRYVSGNEVLEKTTVDKMLDEALSSDELKAVRKIEKQSEFIANLMGLIHGGEWLSQIDHQYGYVLVRKRSP